MAFGLLLLASGVGAELRAERIEVDSVETLRVGGPDSIGGVGDWWLANDVIEAVIDDVGREHAKQNHGGTLVDLGLRDRQGEDQFARLFPIINLTQRIEVGYDAIRAEVDPDGAFARIVVTSSGLRALPRGGFWARALDPLVPDPEDIAEVTVETVYEVRPGEPFVRIETTLTNTGEDGAPVFAFGDVWMRGGRSGRIFLGNTLAPEASRGFRNMGFARDGFPSADAIAAFTHLGLVGVEGFPPIAYALASPERTEAGLPIFGVTEEHVSVAVSLLGSRSPSLGLLGLARALFRELEAGEQSVWSRRVYVAGRSDVAANSDRVFVDLGFADGRAGLRGALDTGARRAVLWVGTEAGAPVTSRRIASGEPFQIVLPPGRYQVELRVAGAQNTTRVIEVPEAAFAEVRFDTPTALAQLRFAPAFADGGPGRIIVEGRDGTPDPRFHDDLWDARLDGAPLPSAQMSRSLWFTGTPQDPAAVALPPGRYRLTATRGLDWNLAQIELTLAEPGSEAAVPPFELEALPPLAGVEVADLHVHAQASDDSQTPNEQRLRAYVAEGVHVLVATDHDHVPDYRPALARLGLADRLRVVHGVEITSSTPSAVAPWTIGHHNAWPVEPRPTLHRAGAPPSQNLLVGELYSKLRREHGAQVLQLNHPRGRKPARHDGSFFTHLSQGPAFDPAAPLDAPDHAPLLEAAADGTRALDFDAIEVMNGKSYNAYRLMRADWHALLRHGVRRTGTANSDTHGADQLAAYPRNYVWVGTDPRPEPQAGFDRALREGRSFGTTGPRIRRFQVGTAEAGALVPGGEAGFVAFEVDAADWVPLEEVRIVVNGDVVHRTTERTGRVPLALDADAFVVLEAGAPLDADAAAWRAAHPGPYTETVVPGFVSAAFSNPIYVDVDGNGRFDGPGVR
ncbi:MAG: CehA/McbA family metallohydrolase [Myxococcota bacterium]